MLLKTFKGFCALVICICFGHIYYLFSGDFTIKHLLKHSKNETSTNQEIVDLREILTLANQKFTYLGHGHQTFVFLADDQKTILKLFMNDFIKHDWKRAFLAPVFPFRQILLQKGDQKTKRLKRLFQGYYLSSHLDPENCGLLYFHKHRCHQEIKTQIVNAFGLLYTIDLNEFVFALQKKAQTTKSTLHTYLSKGDIEGAKIKIKQLVHLYENQFNKGLVDCDRNFLDNTGFIGEKAVRIDVGRVQLNNGCDTFWNEYEKVFHQRFFKWLNKNYPEYTSDFEDIKFKSF